MIYLIVYLLGVLISAYLYTKDTLNHENVTIESFAFIFLIAILSWFSIIVFLYLEFMYEYGQKVLFKQKKKKMTKLEEQAYEILDKAEHLGEHPAAAIAKALEEQFKAGQKDVLNVVIEVLEFYGNEDYYFDEQYSSGTLIEESTMYKDFGKQARRALEILKR